jgi:hypothetical protein
MRKNSLVPLLCLIALIITSLACGGSKTPPQPDQAEETPLPAATEAPAESPTGAPAESEEELPEPSQGEYDTVFPLPEDVREFIGEGGEEMVVFQTNLSLEEVVAFYRQALAAQGLTEREILTVIEDEGFSMVFDGWPDGRSVVVQGVDFGETVNVSIRLEDV